MESPSKRRKQVSESDNISPKFESSPAPGELGASSSSSAQPRTGRYKFVRPPPLQSSGLDPINEVYRNEEHHPLSKQTAMSQFNRSTEPAQPKELKRDPQTGKLVNVVPEKAYKNMEFLNSAAARNIRIQCEFQEPGLRLMENGIDNIVMFFGSAR